MFCMFCSVAMLINVNWIPNITLRVIFWKCKSDPNNSKLLILKYFLWMDFMAPSSNWYANSPVVVWANSALRSMKNQTPKTIVKVVDALNTEYKTCLNLYPTDLGKWRNSARGFIKSLRIQSRYEWDYRTSTCYVIPAVVK